MPASAQIFWRPAFVCVDDQRATRRRAPHGRNTRRITGGAELDLEQRAAGGLLGRGRHDGWRRKRNRVGGRERLWGRQARQLVHGRAALLGAQVPERAVERVARRTLRHRGLQGGALEAARERVRHRADRRDDAVERLAIAGIGHALAAPPLAAVEQLGDHDRRLGLGATADGEGARNGPALGVD
jgi:hypothetical protein